MSFLSHNRRKGKWMTTFQKIWRKRGTTQPFFRANIGTCVWWDHASVCPELWPTNSWATNKTLNPGRSILLIIENKLLGLRVTFLLRQSLIWQYFSEDDRLLYGVIASGIWFSGIRMPFAATLISLPYTWQILFKNTLLSKEKSLNPSYNVCFVIIQNIID